MVKYSEVYAIFFVVKKNCMKKPCKPSYISLKLKLIITYTFLILAIILAMHKFSYYYASKIITDNSLKTSQFIVNKLSTELDNMIDEMDMLTRITLADAELINIFEDKYEPERYLSKDLYKKKYIKDFLSRMLSFRPDLDRILLVNFTLQESYAIKTDSYYFTEYKPLQNEWYKNFMLSESMFSIVPPHLNTENMGYEVFSVVRKIRTFPDSAVLGIVRVDRRTNILNDIFDVRELERNSIILFDEENQPIYFTGIELTKNEKEQIAAEITGTKGIIKINNQDDSKIVSYARSSYTGLLTTFIMPEKILLSDLSAINTFSIILTIICSVISVVFSIVISYAITYSVKVLLKGMRQIEKGNFDTKVSIRSNDEMSVLASGLNSMTEKIQLLMKQNADMEVKKREAELMVLQGQINPHFLYNTLDGIRMKALLGGNEDTASMIEELSSLLRISSSVKTEFVLFKDEVAYVIKYVNLQNMRYRQKLILTIKVPEAIMKTTIPKFILQPIVENSIHHGLEAKKNDRKILISGVCENGKITVTVKDNGLGIEKTLLKDIQTSLDYNEKNDKKIGLKNVHDRLKLYYGPEYMLAITSEEYIGTEVTLTLPMNH